MGERAAKLRIAFALVSLAAAAACGGKSIASSDDAGGPGPAEEAGSSGDTGSPNDASPVPDSPIAVADTSVPIEDTGALDAFDGGFFDGEGGVTDTGVITFDAAPPDAADAAPEVGSPSCEDVPCVLCSDGEYHCHSMVYPACPDPISTANDCTTYMLPSFGCFTCFPDAKGYLWQCKAGAWDLTPFDCTP